MLGYRSNDAVLTICQNNKARTIEIKDLNPPAEELTGLSHQAVAGTHLSQILPPRIGDLLNEYVEYENDANDVGMVLTKVQSFSLIGKDAKEHAYRLKVVRATSSGHELEFKLVLQDKMGLRKDEALRHAIQENFKGHEVLDPAIGLPDRYSLAKDIELMSYYHNKTGLSSCFAVLQLDHHEDLLKQYGAELVVACMRHVAQLNRGNLRPDDMVAVVSPKRIGVLLLDTTVESSRMVVNRLRWQVAANAFILPDGSPLSLSISAVYAGVGGRVNDIALIDRLEKALDKLAPTIANHLEALVD